MDIIIILPWEPFENQNVSAKCPVLCNNNKKKLKHFWSWNISSVFLWEGLCCNNVAKLCIHRLFDVTNFTIYVSTYVVNRRAIKHKPPPAPFAINDRYLAAIPWRELLLRRLPSLILQDHAGGCEGHLVDFVVRMCQLLHAQPSFGRLSHTCLIEGLLCEPYCFSYNTFYCDVYHELFRAGSNF